MSLEKGFAIFAFVCIISLMQTAHAAYINATPNPAYVTAGSSNASVTISWGDAFSSTCLWIAPGSTFNSNTPYPPFCGGTTGSHSYQLPAGHYYVWVSLGTQPNDQAHIPLTVSAPTAPTISASPNPVSGSGDFSFNVTAPGYSVASVYGSFSAGGPYICLGAASPPFVGNGGVATGQFIYLFVVGSSYCPGTNVSSLPNPQLAVVLVRHQ